MNEPLSPAAQAVLNTMHRSYDHEPPRRALAAGVLCAAADQVVPDVPRPSADYDYHLMSWSRSLDQYAQRQQTRAELLALAAELGGTVQEVAHD